jgi:multicomponent Na+:H+ antiporter subunit G
MRLILAAVLVSLGVFLWFWGGCHLLGRKSYFWKIHALGISDTVGTLLILCGVLVYSLENWNYVLLAIGSVVFWGTALSFTLARLGADHRKEEDND